MEQLMIFELKMESSILMVLFLELLLIQSP